MAFNVCLAVFCFFLLPETKGVSLEDIDAVSDGDLVFMNVDIDDTVQLFGGESHRAPGKREDIIEVKEDSYKEDSYHASSEKAGSTPRLPELDADGKVLSEEFIC